MCRQFFKIRVLRGECYVQAVFVMNKFFVFCAYFSCTGKNAGLMVRI